MKRSAQSLEAFTKDLASSLPAPGGGGVGALLAAQGAGLLSMVCCLTMGKKAYAAHEEELQQLDEHLKAQSRRALAMIGEDEENFVPLAKAMGLPRTTLEEKKTRQAQMEAAITTAMTTPEDTLAMAEALMQDAKRLLTIGSKWVQSDVGCGAECILAAAKSSVWNIYINLAMMGDEQQKVEGTRQVEARLSALEKVYEDIVRELQIKLKP